MRGFSTQLDVNGFTYKVVDNSLQTSVIDMSNLNGVAINLTTEVDEGKTPLHSETALLPPEAGLHRDGEQARIVEVVRRRQQVLQQRIHHEQGTFEWLEEMLANTGIIDAPRISDIRQPIVLRDQNNHSITQPLNPYRNSTIPGRAVKHTNSNYESISSTNSTKPNHQSDPVSITHSEYHFFYVLNSLLRASRQFIDYCITCIARLEPIQSNNRIPMYSFAPSYALHITTDDISLLIVITWIAFYISLRIQTLVTPMITMIIVIVGSVCRCVVRRIPLVNSTADDNYLMTKSENGENPNFSSISSTNDGSIEFHNRRGINDAAMSKVSANTTMLPRDDSDVVKRLQKLHPYATVAECKRFFTCVKYNEEAASKRLGEFFKWRSDCGLKAIADASGHNNDNKHDRVYNQEFIKKDEEDWDACARLAVSIATRSSVIGSGATLSQIICSYEEQLDENDRVESPTLHKLDKEGVPSMPPRCTDGTRILHILPSRLDLSIASASTYSLAAALYIDRRMSRLTTEKISLFCDVRGGRGYANPTPWSLLPFVQSTASLLGSHYPERLERLVLYPMPTTAIWVWNAAKKCLDPNTASKVVVIGSGEGSDSKTLLMQFIDEDHLAKLEMRRRSFFVG